MEKINSSNFNEFIAKGLCVVDFFANWCGPCKMLSPILEEVQSSVQNVKIAKLDVDESLDIAMKYSIDVIPNLIFFKDGQVVDKLVGLCTKEEIIKTIEKNI